LALLYLLQEDDEEP